MNIHLKRAAAIMGAVMLSAAVAQAAGVLAAKNGMTLYIYDKDKVAVPSCYGICAAFWPPYMAKTGEKAKAHWSMVKRSHGKLQWAYNGHPLYFYASDKKKGDMKGDGFDGIWHIIKR